MTTDRPETLRVDVVGRAIIELAGVTMAQVAAAMAPDMVVPGWCETSYDGATRGVPDMDFVPTAGTWTIGNCNRRMADGIHLFTADWKDDGTIMQGPAIMVEGGQIPEIVSTAMIGMRLGDVVSAPSVTAELADAVIEWLEHPAPENAKGQTMIGVEPAWLDRSTAKDAP